MMLALPLRRPPTPDAGNNFEIMVRVILEPPHDRRDALFLRREKCIDEVTATFFGKMIEVAVMKSPWPAPRRVHPLRSIGYHLPRCDARKGDRKSTRLNSSH